MERSVSNYSFKKSKKGFTLVEMLIVISIVGLFASLVLVGMKTVRGRAKDVQIKADMNSIGVALEMYAAEHNKVYPKSDNGSGEDTFEILTVEPEHQVRNNSSLAKTAFANDDPVNSPTVVKLLNGYIDKKFPVNENFRGDNQKMFYNYQTNNNSYQLNGYLASDPTKYYSFYHRAKTEGYVASIIDVKSDTSPPFWLGNNDKLTAVKNGNNAILTWDPAIANSGSISSYSIRWKKGGIDQTEILNIKRTNYTIYFSIATGMQYTFQVVAHDSKNNLGFGSKKTITWTATGDTSSPVMVGQINIDPFLSKNDYIYASWDSATDSDGPGDIQGYYLEYSSDNWLTYASVFTTGRIFYQRITPSGQYKIRVRAVDKAGNNSAYLTSSAIINVQNDIQPPSFRPDDQLAVTKSGGVYSLSWPEATDNVGIKKYMINFFDDYGNLNTAYTDGELSISYRPVNRNIPGSQYKSDDDPAIALVVHEIDVYPIDTSENTGDPLTWVSP